MINFSYQAELKFPIIILRLVFASSPSPSSYVTFSFKNPRFSTTDHHPITFGSPFMRPVTFQRTTAEQSMEGQGPPKEGKLWGGRFEEGVTDAVERFTESISYDKKLYKHDILGSRAHASMLAKQGLISFSDRDSIFEGLDHIEKQIERGEFQWRIDREDVHMNIEASLTDLIGEPAKKLHTARSRNDQVSTDFRLWCRDAIDKIVARIKHLQVELVSLAMKNEGVIVPGYTHRAQPVLLQHHLLAYVEQLDRDARQLLDCRKRMNFCPLGACALAGTGLPIDRFMTSDALGFTAPMKNSMDAVSDRDFVLELLCGNFITAVHLTWLVEELFLCASEDPDDSDSTKMPQKKNPDRIEFIRESFAKVVGDLVTLQVLCKGLPLSYNRDLQEDKEPTFDSVDTIIGMLEVTSELAENITINQHVIQKDLPSGCLDTMTLADYLVHKGLCTTSERDSILEGVNKNNKKIERRRFEYREDVHKNTDLIAEPAKKLDSNDKVSSKFLLHCWDAIDNIIARIKHLQVALVNLAMKNEGVIVPGYTHLQRAQPVLLQHHLLAYVEQLDRDAGRLLDCKKRMDFNMSGPSLTAGTGLLIDSMKDRAFLLELLSANSIIAMHLSRLGEEWVLWASEEFGFITPSDSVSTGSSIMPQKKNPDPMELVRGKSARVVGDLVTLQVLCKGLPQRDSQEDKKPALDSIETIIGMLEVTSEFAQNITYNQDVIKKALSAGHLDATTLADYLVHKGIPFRSSHDIVGRAVRVYKKCELQELCLEELRSIDMVFDTDVYDYLGVENSIKNFKSYGSTGSQCVAAQLAFWITKLNINQ